VRFVKLPNGNFILPLEVAAVQLVGFATHVLMLSGQTVRASADDKRIEVMQILARSVEL
jgi:hypothetical protein